MHVFVGSYLLSAVARAAPRAAPAVILGVFSSFVHSCSPLTNFCCQENGTQIQ